MKNLTLEEALVALVSTLRGNYREINCELSFGTFCDELEDTIRVTIYCIVQECLTNASRHSRAKQAQVQVCCTHGSRASHPGGDRL
jgi:signal transduction histidine kinase